LSEAFSAEDPEVHRFNEHDRHPFMIQNVVIDQPIMTPMNISRSSSHISLCEATALAAVANSDYSYFNIDNIKLVDLNTNLNRIHAKLAMLNPVQAEIKEKPVKSKQARRKHSPVDLLTPQGSDFSSRFRVSKRKLICLRDETLEKRGKKFQCIQVLPDHNGRSFFQFFENSRNVNFFIFLVDTIYSIKLYSNLSYFKRPQLLIMAFWLVKIMRIHFRPLSPT
jgi:hypothetical protein